MNYVAQSTLPPKTMTFTAVLTEKATNSDQLKKMKRHQMPHQHQLLHYNKALNIVNEKMKLSRVLSVDTNRQC